MMDVLFLDELDMGNDLSNRIFEQLYDGMDRNKNGFIDGKELTEYFIRIADKDNCIIEETHNDWPADDEDW